MLIPRRGLPVTHGRRQLDRTLELKCGGVDELAFFVHLGAEEVPLDDGAVHHRDAGLVVECPAQVGDKRLVAGDDDPIEAHVPDRIVGLHVGEHRDQVPEMSPSTVPCQTLG